MSEILHEDRRLQIEVKAPLSSEILSGSLDSRGSKRHLDASATILRYYWNKFVYNNRL
jgi:hypothetical protein